MSKIPIRNQNHTGWWVFSTVEQWVSKSQMKLSPKSRRRVWESTILIRANSRDAAYRKAMTIGKLRTDLRMEHGSWRFVGISNLTPIYEPIEDGSEIQWSDLGMMSDKAIRTLVRTKGQLPLFDDKARTR